MLTFLAQVSLTESIFLTVKLNTLLVNYRLALLAIHQILQMRASIA
jgi:hypothetical protein